MIILPAIDLYDRKVVRLYQGDYDQQEVFGADPLEFAKSFAIAGAKYLHLVDLNGAKEGTKKQFDLVAEIVQQTDLFVELGGGIRSEADIEDCLAVGVKRVILGTIAQKKPEFAKAMIAKYGEKIAVGVDAREGMVAVNGWLETTQTDAYTFCQELVAAGCQTIIYTDIAKDGTGAGMDIAAYQKLNQLGCNIVASGGVATIEDIKGLVQVDTYGTIVGKALYSGQLDLAACLFAAEVKK
ncbi:1-(5-phosphoribosyl)-5-[(5-phosphoribosylamino)methylideneamino]imidazole-4-carboxamide isomerase [Enterococcus sp. SMC-9]|uniref:1-(5-phosphoribosyl)-5-[(5- phosphoribosylamino)methylideneamino]imidazole-4- carboxamide isomerase n=1 Tax=Enterococcus sp. SMC-9 TaxID=2862343 RepID=UPI001E6292A7|nr:1-(5-phosphoribosyl)-5-[(5-phosphoribosylamino)methylideneamino]imidazole-4-carboxamide isomerase [Enterococcus sp. SMC-9]MCD1025435.1 1-(5-phosphoribosyl)-5-[(5-phosphoribosylamino)methylideneamino]imidazole-4-carboxamide isomerase [Enterococcus sp. SMC-9]